MDYACAIAGTQFYAESNGSAFVWFKGKLHAIVIVVSTVCCGVVREHLRS